MIFATDGIQDRMREYEFGSFVVSAFERFLTHDYGDVEIESKRLNDLAFEQGEQVIGVYNVPKQIAHTLTGSDRIYIIGDAMETEIMLAGEY